MTEVPPTGSSGHAHQYRLTAAMRHTWQKLFKHDVLTDKDIRQLNDSFTKNVGDQMNNVMQWAIKQQKDRDDEEKKQQGGG